MNKAAFALILLVFSATLAADDPSSWSPAQVEVWRTVQARTDAWGDWSGLRRRAEEPAGGYE